MQKWIAVIVAPNATAAVEFKDETEKCVAYRFRCFVQGQEGEQVGTGVVFERYRMAPDEKLGKTLLIDDSGRLFVQAGPIKVEWS